MDERKLHKILGQDLEVPDMVNKKLREAWGMFIATSCRKT